jgi:biotin carboxyl carrier protein
MSWQPEVDEIRRRGELAKAMGGPVVAPHAGTVAAIVVGPGDLVQAGDVLLTIAARTA